MQKKKFEVKIYYSSYCTYEIEANNKEDAVIKARTLPINNNEILSNVENWTEADTANKL